MPNYVTHRIKVSGPEDKLAALVDKMIKQEPGRFSGMTQLFDFNALVPMPERLRDMTKGSELNVGLALLGYEGSTLEKMQRGNFSSEPEKIGVKKTMTTYLKRPWAQDKGIYSVEDMEAYLKNNHPKAIELAERGLANLRDYGYTDWYDWAIDNWGTKWNACNYSQSARRDGYWEFNFDTAWSYVEPIFEHLSNEFPELEFDVAYIDEGWGFAGTEVWVEGTSVSQAMQEYDKEDESYMRQMYEEVFGEPPEDEEEEEDNPFDGTTGELPTLTSNGEKL
jgi:hypothetical protein